MDTAGQEDYAAIRDNYLRNGEGYLCVYSVCERESFVGLREFKTQILRVKERIELNEIPFVLVANKIDMDDSREVTEEEGRALADEWQVPYIETSAKTNNNVDTSFIQLVRQVHLLKKEAMNKARENSLTITKKYKRKHKFKTMKCVIS